MNSLPELEAELGWWEVKEPTLRELEIEYMAAVMNMLREKGLLTKEAWEKANEL
jgi:hypothetical protein